MHVEESSEVGKELVGGTFLAESGCPSHHITQTTASSPVLCTLIAAIPLTFWILQLWGPWALLTLCDPQREREQGVPGDTQVWLFSFLCPHSLSFTHGPVGTEGRVAEVSKVAEQARVQPMAY